MLKINRLIEKITTHSFSQNIRPNKLLTSFKDILQFGLPGAQRTLEIENFGCFSAQIVETNLY